MTRTVACQACGGVLQEDDRFCPRCGANNAAAADSVAAAGRIPSVWDLVGDALRAATRGEFEIAGELGHGGMAAVYLAHDIALDKKVAIKVMAPTMMADRSMLERFLQEARTVAKLEHPHIVTVHTARQAGGLNFFVMKFVEGLELEAVLQRTGALRLALARAILYEVAGALQYAHDRDVVHRDVKPSNIMLDTTGKTFVTDFGIAKLKGGKGLTMHGAAIGTPQYMSPEQCMAGPVSAASDQYSLGVVAYHMLTGNPPFNGEPLTVMRAQVEQAPPRLDRLADGPCPREVRVAIERMLDKEPEARWPSVLQAVKALGGQPIGPDDPVRNEIMRLVKTPDFIPATAMFTTPLSPAPAIARASPPPAAPTRPTTPVPSLVPPAPPVRAPKKEKVAAPTAVVPVFDELRIAGAPRSASPGASFGLRATLRSRNGPRAPATNVAWESSDASVASVEASGRVRVLSPGSVTLTATAQGLRGSARVTVRVPRPLPWRLIGGAAAGVAVVALLLVWVLRPKPPPVRQPVVAQVGGDQVTATVRVERVTVPVAAVRVSPGRATLGIGRTVRLTAAVLDRTGKPLTDRTVTWRSSNDGTATVSSEGVVGALAPGSVRIVAAVDGVEGIADIQVNAPKSETPAAPSVMTVAVEPAEVSLTVGETQNLTAAPRDVQGRTMQRPVTWRSEDDAIATVSSAGVVEGMKAGRVHVNATSDGVTGSATVMVTPVVQPVPPPTVAIVIAGVVAGGRHTCVRSQTGRVWCWGDNAAGQVRAGAGAAVSQPTALDAQNIGALAAGGTHSCALRDDGQAQCWGSNLEGQLGGGSRTSREVIVPGRRFTALAAGADHTCGLTKDGAVLCWGKNDFGQLGDGSTSRRLAPTPAKVPGPISAIATGASHTCALHRDGRLFCWGDDWSGQVGSGMRQSILDPTQVGGALRFENVGAGQIQTCGLTREGKIYCWGQEKSSPTVTPSSEPFSNLAVGGAHVCGLTRSGRALCWGRGQEGQLGNGGRQPQSAPVAARTSEEFVALAAGQNHTCGLAKSGQLLCWGANARGELGTGGTATSLIPSPLAALP
ncbi:MAG TPA: protein kinase [Gemmatimonadales bacterium]|nr:protein kinase [Gemmatimonadales bacterium]